MIYNRVCMIFTCQSIHTTNQVDVHCIVRDSSAVRRLFVQLAGAVWRQGALHKENSGFADPTLDRHISAFRGYRIVFPIQNPYINRFTNTFSIHSWPFYPQKVVLQHDLSLDPIISPYHFHFQTFVTWLRENYDYRNVSWEMNCIYDLTLSKNAKWEGVDVTHALSEAHG